MIFDMFYGFLERCMEDTKRGSQQGVVYAPQLRKVIVLIIVCYNNEIIYSNHHFRLMVGWLSMMVGHLMVMFGWVKLMLHCLMMLMRMSNIFPTIESNKPLAKNFLLALKYIHITCMIIADCGNYDRGGMEKKQNKSNY